MSPEFHQFDRLVWLWVIPVVIGLVAWHLRQRQRRRARFASARLHDAIMPDASDARTWWRAGLWTIALLALVTAAMDPRWGTTYEDVPQSGIDVLIVLDTSRSMLAEDVMPNRLERAKVQIGDLVRQLRGDRVGLMTFAGKPTLRCPLTTDYGAMLMTLEDAQPELEERGGSLLGDAIRAAAEVFPEEGRDHQALVIFTDGEDHESYPIEAAATLHEETGVRVFTIGLGDTEQGARVPTGRTDGPRYVMFEGREVWSRMDQRTLRECALAGDGAFVPVGTRVFSADSFYTETIATLTGRSVEAARVRRVHVRYQWFIGLALCCLLVESVLIDRRRASASSATLWRVTNAAA